VGISARKEALKRLMHQLVPAGTDTSSKLAARLARPQSTQRPWGIFRAPAPLRQKAFMPTEPLPAGYPPSQVTPATALVGLLTSASEVPAFSSRQAQTNNAHHDNGHKEGGTSHIHGYSGGAVPDLHRSSLFVERPGRTPDHQRSRRQKTVSYYGTDRIFVKRFSE